MSTLLTILHVVVCLFLMLTVLLQSGKGGGMGALGGGAGTATVFGGSGASTFLRRLTAGAGTVFMLTSMTLAFLASHNSGDALEKFGAQQQDLATQKEKEKERALEGGSGGSATGSGAVQIVPSTSSMSVDTGSAQEPVGSGDTTPIMGSGFAPGPATNPTPSADHPNSGSAGTPTTGSAGSPTPTPAAAPKAPAGQGTQSVEHPERAAAPKADAPKVPAAAPKADVPKTETPAAPAAPTPAPAGSAQ